MSRYGNLVKRFSHKKILVIGDLVLDQYIHGSVSRISPEAPVPVVFQEDAHYSPGAGANVANNLRSLGAQVTLVGRVGEDREGKILLQELKNRRIPIQGIFIDPGVPTPLKTRIIAEHQQVVRVDRESFKELHPNVLKKIIQLIKKNFNFFDAMIISDYGKGVINPELIGVACYLGEQYRKIITIDPKVEHFSYYRRVTAITPNRKEAENAIRNIKISDPQGSLLKVHSDQLKTDAQINLAGQELLKYLELECLLLTLGEKGMKLFERGKRPVDIHGKAQEVFDVSGAGDTVAAVFTLALTAGATKQEAADLANEAAGIVVGKLGTVPVDRQELWDALR